MAIFNTVPPLAAGAGIKFDGERISTAAAPRNWLDNSDFTNLIAQAGIGGKHGSVAYAADRWKLTSGTVTYTAGTGLTLNGTITQVLETAPTGGSWFVGMASGTATIALNGNIITITSNGGVIKWAALYEGTYSADTLPEYQPKGYSVELHECMRYFACIRAWRTVPCTINWDGSTIFFAHIPVIMRINPTASNIKGTLYANGSSINIDEVPSEAINSGDGLQIRMTTKHTEVARHAGLVELGDVGINFSADL